MWRVIGDITLTALSATVLVVCGLLYLKIVP
jgi:hypothetical protein